VRIEKTYRRPPADRWLRALLAALLPRPMLFRLALAGAWPLRPLAPLLARVPGLARLAAMVALAPARIPAPSRVDLPQVFPAEGERRARVALMSGCAQQALAPEINEATVRLLTRHGVEVVVAEGAGCCGALTHHMGKEDDALAAARANTAAWSREIDGEGLDAIVINASGCGTSVKDYGHMLADDPEWSERAMAVASRTRDVTELIAEIGLGAADKAETRSVAYHAACSLQHGQKITAPPKALLREAGFEVRDVAEGHLCCGSAGTYNILQPALAERLLARKAENIARTGADIVAAGNIGCITQIARAVDRPVVHTVQLLDWATGGPKPAAID
jgi:glycolate oxidase iron-sulfur subunit